MTTVIVGGSLAGIRTAQALRSSDYTDPIVVLGEETSLPYDRPPLSKQMLEPGCEPVPLLSAAELESLRIDLRLGARASALDPLARVVTTNDGDAVGYDQLVIATGSRPRQLPGTKGLQSVYTLRTCEDALALRDELDRAHDVVVIGAGFIGAEFASAARSRQLPVTVVEAQPVPLAHLLGEEVGAALGGLHDQHGTRLRTGVAVAGLHQHDGAVTGVELADGTALPADLVVVGIGASPVTDWLVASGIPLRDGVVCDSTLRVVGFPNVYAAGDVARFPHALYGEDLRIEHWTNANEHAVTVAAAITGNEPPAPSVPYVWSDQYGRRIQIIGRPAAGRLVATVGDLAAGTPFAAVYADDDGAVIGGVVVDDTKLFMKLRRAAMQRLAVEDVPLGTLARH